MNAFVKKYDRRAEAIQVSDTYMVYVGLSNGDLIGEAKVYYQTKTNPPIMLMLSLPLTYRPDATRCRTYGGGIVGNASKRCNAGTVTLGSVTHYELCWRRTRCGKCVRR